MTNEEGFEIIEPVPAPIPMRWKCPVEDCPSFAEGPEDYVRGVAAEHASWHESAELEE